MARKSRLEQLADAILMDAAIKAGYVVSVGNKHGFGKWMREKGMLHPHAETEIAEHEKTGFDSEQLEQLEDEKLTHAQRKRYQ